VVLLGGGSEIGQAVVRAVVDGAAATVVIAARDPDAIDAAPLGAVAVERLAFDARACEAHAAVVDSLFAGGDVDLVVLAFGVLGDQAGDEHDADAAVAVAETNFVGAVSMLTRIADRLREQGHGAIVVLSSVAAQRARRSNYVYGASKAGLDAFASGLQLALRGTGVTLLLVRPGFVRTAMTRHLRPMPLAAQPDDVGTAVAAALRSGRGTIWVPASLRLVMWVIQLLPARALRKL
jgi:decaprenylphospho-beta-D-erythro-pentofuranosid-2-ulose 2-reductase